MKMLIEANRYLWPDLSTRSINQRSSDKNDQNCHVPLQRRKDAHVPADGSSKEETSRTENVRYSVAISSRHARDGWRTICGRWHCAPPMYRKTHARLSHPRRNRANLF